MMAARAALVGAACLLSALYAAVGALALQPNPDIPFRLYYGEMVLRHWPFRTHLLYEPGAVIRPTADLEYLGRDGWSASEPGGMWTDGDEASLFLRLADGPPTLRLRAAITAYNERYPEVDCDVAANGQVVARWVFRDGEPPGERSAPVPASLVRGDGLLRLTFRLHTPGAERRDRGADRRGVEFAWLILEPAE
jgi:hypothetical protein